VEASHPDVGARSSVEGPPNLLGVRRWALATVLVAGILALHTVLPPRTHDERWPSPLHATLWLVELLAAMYALSIVFRWSKSHQLGPKRTLLATVATSIALACGASTVGALLFSPGSVSTAVTVGVAIGVMQAAVWALAFAYPFAAEESRFRALEAERLRATADLARLRSQLEPHFLLNTLNTIAGFVTASPAEARRLLACLGDLLRDAASESDEPQTVEREVAWLRQYASILEARYPGALEFHWDIAEDVASARIPRLLLQPLVENAVKHGALRRGSDGKVCIKISRGAGPAGEKVVCIVEDNGNAPTAPPRAAAFGLRAVRQKLELECRGATFEWNVLEHGARAVIELPFVSSAAEIAR
jgi:hypothetical protein